MPPAVKWTEKYRPDTLKQVLGNGKAIEELRAWAMAWESGTPITGAVILYGPAGTGKTSAALALARELDWDYIEMNASDARTASMIQKIAGPASRSMTFSGKPRLVILDEADNCTAMPTGAERRPCCVWLKRHLSPSSLSPTSITRLTSL